MPKTITPAPMLRQRGCWWVWFYLGCLAGQCPVESIIQPFGMMGFDMGFEGVPCHFVVQSKPLVCAVKFTVVMGVHFRALHDQD